jgi:hypothetical protein
MKGSSIVLVDRVDISFPEGKPDGDWGDSLQSSRLGLGLPWPPTEGQQQFLGLAKASQELALHWVYKKKWNPQHPIPKWKHLKDVIKTVEPFGDVLLGWLNLCESLHTIAPNGYRSAGEWFAAIACEIHAETFDAGLCDGKDSLFVQGRASTISAKLRRGTNPFDQARQPHQWLAVNLALNLKAGFPVVYRDRLIGTQRQQAKGLQCAYSAFCTFQEKGQGLSLRMEDDGNMTTSIGRGKGRSIVRWKTHGRNLSPATLAVKGF